MKLLHVTLSASLCLLAACEEEREKPTTSMMTTSDTAPIVFDDDNWKFPVDELKPRKAVLCLFKSEDGETSFGGARIECGTIQLPDINYAYEKSSDESPEIMLNFDVAASSLEMLVGKTLSLGEDVENCGEDLGSVYLFGAHNPVGWQTIEFGSVEGGSIEAMVDLYFDFQFEDRIGGAFRHKMPVKFVLERRWEL